MASQGECFMSGPLATILRVTRCAGMAPLRFQKQGDGWRVSLTRRFCILPFITTIINVIFIWTLVVIIISQIPQKTNQCVLLTDAILTTVLVATLVYGAPERMRCLISLLNQVQKINSELNIHQWSTPWTRKQIILSIIWGAFSVTVNLTSFSILVYLNLTGQTLDYYFLVGNVFQFLRFCITSLIELGVIQFVQLVLHVQTSFTAVNDCLTNLMQDKTTITTAHKTVHRISSAYSATCAVVRDVNRSYELMLTIMISYLFLQLLISSYHLADCLFILPDAMTSRMLLRTTIPVFNYFVYCFVNLMLFIEPCHWTNVEMERTQNLVRRLILYPHSAFEPLAIELEQFWAQLELNDVSYTPLQIVTFTRSFILALFGSITTYLVILIDTTK